MDRQTLRNELQAIVGEYLKAEGFELIDLIFRYEGRDLFLRVLADRPYGGITLDECSFINIKLSRILDEKNIIQERYFLEVSSPGLDRPLKLKNDFLRCLDKKARIFLNESVNGKIEFEGVVTKVDEQSVYVDAGQIVAIPLSKINKAKQVI